MWMWMDILYTCILLCFLLLISVDMYIHNNIYNCSAARSRHDIIYYFKSALFGHQRVDRVREGTSS
jgi:hypothetical protein